MVCLNAYFEALVHSKSYYPRNFTFGIFQYPGPFFVKTRQFGVGEKILQFLALPVHADRAKPVAGLPFAQTQRKMQGVSIEYRHSLVG